MRLEGLGRVGRGHARVPEAPVFVLLRADIVRVGERLERIDDDQVRCTYSRVGKVCTEAGLEDGKYGLVGRVDGCCAGGGNEVREIA